MTLSSKSKESCNDNNNGCWTNIYRWMVGGGDIRKDYKFDERPCRRAAAGDLEAENERENKMVRLGYSYRFFIYRYI